ncbi:hypothetical protein VTJ49DRAFT_1471 [Mycothermus thermophilus]|uniref:non-specific serine/threonine protein kinase n=1 Tax=Humicola insolens TaxID=85995 RepID=A0ABR3VCM7_HUMIN
MQRETDDTTRREPPSDAPAEAPPPLTHADTGSSSSVTSEEEEVRRPPRIRYASWEEHPYLTPQQASRILAWLEACSMPRDCLPADTGTSEEHKARERAEREQEEAAREQREQDEIRQTLDQTFQELKEYLGVQLPNEAELPERPARGDRSFAAIAMATNSLQVRVPDFASSTKQKAIEDAKKMQEIVEEDCKKAGKDVPPYQLEELIGKGNYGRVYKATDLKSKALVAVKIINIEEGDTLNPKLADTYSEFMKEFSTLKLLSESGAKNINLTLDVLPVGHAMWMVTEYCAGGSVATLMKPTAPGGLQEKWIIPIVREVAEAIYWVHKEGIIHRDIKCANVLVTEKGSVQLCDFGVAGLLESKMDKRTTFIGTLNWMAPELFDPVPSYSTPVDIWAFGSLVYELANGLPPNVHAGFSIHELGQYIKHHAPRLEGDYSDEIKDLVAFCLVEDPAKRPTIQEIQRHPYIYNTSETYPTSSLANLVKAYRLWEGQGGIRRSLFAPVGVQGPLDQPSTETPSDEWNFSTTVDFDRQVMNTDAQAVFDVYGSNVDFDFGNPQLGQHQDQQQNSRPGKNKRRRPPPQLQPTKAPLEKVFDPNTISNYEDNSRAYYGRAPPPPITSNTTSDLPLRDDSLHSTLRESLIDLDASFDGEDLSQYVDMATIRAGGGNAGAASRLPSDPDYYDDATDFNKPPLSDPADLNPNRRTQDWKFPTMIPPPPASANPDVFRFPFHDGPGERSDPMTQSADGFLAEPYDGIHHAPPLRNLNPDNHRASVDSLIDLDEGLVTMPTPVGGSAELTRPSTANSDAASVTGSDVGGATDPFVLERHASLLYQPPIGIREPSIYVSDDSEFAHLVAQTTDVTPAQTALVTQPQPDFPAGSIISSLRRGTRSASHSRSTSYDDDSYLVQSYSEMEYLTMASSGTLMGGPGSSVSSFSIPDRAGASSRAARTRGRSQSNASIASGYMPSQQAPQQLLLQSQQQQMQPQQQYPRTMSISGTSTTSFSSATTAINGLGLTNLDAMGGSDAGGGKELVLPLGVPPAPPSARVMQGAGGRDQVRDEVVRLLASFSEQLAATSAVVQALPQRRRSAALTFALICVVTF